MKKILLAVIAVLLLGIGAYFSLEKENTKTTIEDWDSDFSIADTSQITRFFIAQKTGATHLFEKQESGEWKVNNKWQSEKDMVNLILGTIHEMKLKAPVLKSMRNTIIKELASRGIKVELYNKEGLIKTFYIGESTGDELGTYIIMEGSEVPYVVHIPRLKGFLTSRFRVNKKAWLDKVLFKSKRNKIMSLSVNYPVAPENGFDVVKDSVSFKIDDSNFNTDKEKLNAYMTLFEAVHAEQIPKMKDREGLDDSLATVTPHAIFQLEDENPEFSNKITLYNIGSEERMLCFVDDRDYYVVVQLYAFKKLLVTKEYFKKIQLDL